MINGFLLIVNMFVGKLFTLSEDWDMKRIVFYCGVYADDDNDIGVYVRNAKEYLCMTDPERVAVLTGLIAEFSQELEFVSRQISRANNPGISSEGPRIPQ